MLCELISRSRMDSSKSGAPPKMRRSKIGFGLIVMSQLFLALYLSPVTMKSIVVQAFIQP